jgi:lactate permease
VAWLLGPEFPSMLGALTGMLIVIPAAQRGFLLPREETPWQFADRAEWPSEWSGETATNPVTTSANSEFGLLRAWTPYVLVAALLVATRVKAFGLLALIKSVNIPLDGLLGSSISHTVAPLYLPGTVFCLVALLCIPIQGLRPARFALACRMSVSTIIKASVALIFTVPMVQVFINSAGGTAGYAAMPQTLAEGVAGITGTAWPFFATFIGGLGAAIAGSNTVSNMMFSLFQFDVGTRLHFDPLWVVALQAVGGAAGNTICVHNIVAASAVVGMTGREGTVIRRTFPIFCWYAMLTGSIGYSILHYPVSGLLNAGSIATAVLIAAFALFVRRCHSR